ncbi:hypothetical protein ACH3VR_23170 [Microbacterium sp. B2969]|uniref:Uncharacterized protein n=1 Tax=Microbacterium alkaliflavum TaxID=3248839 RepID=A0ABW7QEE9_9MICO
MFSTQPESDRRPSLLSATLAGVLGWIVWGLLAFAGGVLFVLLVHLGSPGLGVMIGVIVFVLALAAVLELARRRLRR